MQDHLNRARYFSAAPSYVLAFAGQRDDCSGDVQGIIGIGKKIAERTGREFVYLDDCTIQKLYPDAEDISFAYSRFSRENGRPDILLSPPRIIVPATLRAPFQISELNEHFSWKCSTPYKSLVPNNLTAETLNEEERQFRARHPALHDTIISVLHISTDGKTDYFAEKLSAMLAADEDLCATIYLCGTRHTDFDEQNDLYRSLRSQLVAHRIDNRIQLLNFHLCSVFAERSGYNPYKGLLATADHFVVLGESLSLTSEPLVRGRSVMHMGPVNMKFERLGWVHDFEKLDAAQGLPTRIFEPVNITDEVADYYVTRLTEIGAPVGTAALQNNFL